MTPGIASLNPGAECPRSPFGLQGLHAEGVKEIRPPVARYASLNPGLLSAQPFRAAGFTRRRREGISPGRSLRRSPFGLLVCTPKA